MTKRRLGVNHLRVEMEGRPRRQLQDGPSWYLRPAAARTPQPQQARPRPWLRGSGNSGPLARSSAGPPTRLLGGKLPRKNGRLCLAVRTETPWRGNPPGAGKLRRSA